VEGKTISGNIGHVSVPATTGVETKSGDAAADAYLRAVQAKPTDFAENPIGAVANAMDKLGKAAGGLLHRADGANAAQHLAQDEAALRETSAAVKANPGSKVALQNQLKAAAQFLQDLQQLAPNDPRRAKVASLVVNLASALGPEGLRGVGGDTLGVIRLAAQLVSRFGDGAGMQKAFSVEQMLRQLTTGTSPQAMQLLDQLASRFSMSQQALRNLLSSWKITVAAEGELPNVNLDARTISINAANENASLAALAKAHWLDAGLSNPADKDGFIKAFVKIANSGLFSPLNRKYREVRRMAKDQLATARGFESVGGTVTAVQQKVQQSDDESADMFAALAVFSRTPEGNDLPDSVRPALGRLFA
jgi:hypothetical protein